MSRLERVSVLMGAYNHERFIDQAIRSAILQREDYPADLIEIIVVNDGSTDATGERAAAYTDQVRVIDKPNGGMLSTVNRLIEEATGDLMCFVSTDDYLLPGHLGRLARFLSANSWVSLVYGDAKIVDADGHTLQESFTELNGVTRAIGDIHGPLMTRNFICPVAAMMRTQVREAAWPIGPPACWEDWWLHWHAGEFGETVSLAGNDACYRRHGSNLLHGVTGPAAVENGAREIPFLRWLLTNGWRPGIPLRDVIASRNRFDEVVSAAVAYGLGSRDDLVPVDEAGREHAADLVAEATSGSATAELSAIKLIQALAWDPDAAVAHRHLPAAVAAAQAASPPLQFGGPIVMSFAAELVHRPGLLSGFVSAAEGLRGPSLVIDAHGWTDERIANQLMPVAQRCGVDGSDTEVVVVTGSREWPKKSVVATVTEIDGVAVAYDAPAVHDQLQLRELSRSVDRLRARVN